MDGAARLDDSLLDVTAHEDVVYALAASPRFARDGVCFAASQSGLARSRDGGQTWKDAYASLGLEAPLATVAVAVSPDFHSDHTVIAGAPGGVLLSTDSGRRWNAVLLPPPAPSVTVLAFSPNFEADGTLFLGTLEDGVFRSADRGRHWAAGNFGLLDLNILCLAVSPGFAGDETLAVGTESGIYQSTNGGRSWRELEFPLEWAPVLSLAYFPTQGTDGGLLAGTEEHGLWRSDDEGQSWTQLGRTALKAEVNAIVPFAPPAGRLSLLAMLPERLLLSRDAGRHWTLAGRCEPEATFTAIAAPAGLATGAPLVVGLSNGQKTRLTLGV
jgi:photosystem II stability/assembly factor-like uncharacterized protein